MGKRKQQDTDVLAKIDLDQTLRGLLSEKIRLYEQIKESGGEIPEEYEQNDLAIKQKIDDYGLIIRLHENDMERIENKIAPFQEIVDIGKAQIKAIKESLARFKAYTCDIIEGDGEPGGADGKKRLAGENFWLKSLYRLKRELREGLTTDDLPDDYKYAVVRMPMSDYNDFYSHLELVDILPMEPEKLPDEYTEDKEIRNVQLYQNTTNTKALEVMTK